MMWKLEDHQMQDASFKQQVHPSLPPSLFGNNLMGHATFLEVGMSSTERWNQSLKNWFADKSKG